MAHEKNKDNPLKASQIFGLPVFEKSLPRFADHAPGITQHLYRLKDRDKGVNRFNQGGWQSPPTLHQTRHIDTRWLLERLYQISANAIQSHKQERNIKDIRMASCWANINYKGDWIAPHEHPHCNWSGVFQIDAGEPDSANSKQPLAGHLMLLDPTPGSREWHGAGFVSFAPVTGTLLLFPSFLTRMVAPHLGEKPRLSLNFNLRVLRSPS